LRRRQGRNEDRNALSLCVFLFRGECGRISDFRLRGLWLFVTLKQVYSEIEKGIGKKEGRQIEKRRRNKENAMKTKTKMKMKTMKFG
jgi:hypothetical protein